jgi:hypothetical protein
MYLQVKCQGKIPLGMDSKEQEYNTGHVKRRAITGWGG